ncbi:bifunctional 3-(3-hydroxy-phenyl)propionate/3-hydroxycinnamic acid hydroxylase [Streptomyces radicis]|uniref:Bifunctional 3-(3-hydroxy-phenyl)propionate/3-hydroxycinnamic acid hydroxylase n=1 Tax=Streptomyces radicis TaxID=1750517 RepID=A0A3A9VVQ6_9ACTN|nr:bifunctional 3-(3-hydroxy-phenyl)propionate/3-hydroxycinnamic acid hydroxylase [Streptomyces radicis]RKN04243.1 bifunctional 3-(3-hydroxy-phenyl)propionate/3-hydroxycinnamic acid hydroxylase [Streptomyces radicis]RKN14761.1 bifunctional 3-(3-hydroxy-phenyl)propionate/3-hydroxycinnamic acid hydroxylase [Streptomyces radicis]
MSAPTPRSPAPPPPAPDPGDTCDVAVVGAGPVGLALAALLSAEGVKVAVVDPHRVVCQHPRATHLDDETMRTLQTLGAADLEPLFLRQSGWVLTGADEQPFLELAMPDTVSDQGWYTDYQFHQPDFESRLRGLLATRDGARLWLGWEAVALDQDAEGAGLVVRERRSGRVRCLRAAYVVGADGAGSFVRAAMGADVEDLRGTQTSLIVDVHPFHHPDSLPRTTGFVRCDAERPLTYVPIFPPLLRFEFMLDTAADPAEAERPEHVYPLLSRWLAPGSYRVLRADAYEWHAHLVRGWRDGRLLLAGDAAHEMPPMLGQGLCSGLRDAANLAWKLALVLRGRAEGTLLDTYESERAAHVRPYIVESARQANMIEAFGRGERPPASTAPRVVERFRPPLGPGLVERPADPVGQLAPQPRGPGGERLDDATGYRFVAVGAPEVIAGVDDATRAHWRRLGLVAVAGGGPVVREWLAERGAKAALVRPDRYVYGVAADAAGLVDVTGRLAERLLPSAVTA